MATLYLRNVPDEVVRRLRVLAARGGTSVNAVAVRELADATRRADNADLLGALPNREIDTETILADLDAGRGSG
jgi:plasmid stability protein